jgi:hypothetical protein
MTRNQRVASMALAKGSAEIGQRKEAFRMEKTRVKGLAYGSSTHNFTTSLERCDADFCGP